MAAHSNRSPSPLSSRPINPNFRNTENHSTTRKSFNGDNPFPKHSAITNPRKFDPSDSCLKKYEEKENDENEQILKASKLQSPAKGSKHFMAPTISAASKFTPPPRKKPLVERNDPVRTSIWLSDGKTTLLSNISQDLDPKSEMGFNQNQKTPSSFDLQAPDSEKNESVSNPSFKKVTFLDVPKDSKIENQSFSSDNLKMDSSSKNNNISCSPISNPIAPLDADPSMPPYDPKTNYLSPRPRFLYYRPNPRIEVLLNKENNSFMEECMSDNFSSESEEDKSEGIASDDMVIGLDFSEYDYIHVSKDSKEEAFASTDTLELESSDEEHEGIALEEAGDDDRIHVEKNESKLWRGITKTMCFSMVIMMMLFMAACVTQSPSFEELGLTKDSSFSDLGNLYHQSRVVAAFEKLDLDRVVRGINQFSLDCVSFVSKVARELGTGETTMVSMKYMNLSNMQISSWDDDYKGCFINNNDEVVEGLVENVEDVDDESEEEDSQIENFEEEEEEAYMEYDLRIKMEKIEEENEARIEYDDNSDGSLDNEIDMQDDGNVSKIEEIISNSEYLEGQVEIIVPTGQESEFEAEVEIINSEIVEIEKTDRDMSPVSDTTLHENVENSVTPESSSPPQLQDRFHAHYYYAIGISSLLAALLAFARFRHNRNQNIGSSTNVVEDRKQMYQEKKKKAFSSQNLKREVGDESSSWPSETSSFQKSASCDKNKNKEFIRGASEVQSIERRTRKYNSKRESSSSEFTTGSPSYGSFTTFEKIPIKNANVEEEIMTPVRRSSRIRSHQL